jgi:HAD superfamily hydrolase (TIGR01458 family)
LLLSGKRIRATDATGSGWRGKRRGATARKSEEDSARGGRRAGEKDGGRAARRPRCGAERASEGGGAAREPAREEDEEREDGELEERHERQRARADGVGEREAHGRHDPGEKDRRRDGAPAAEALEGEHGERAGEDGAADDEARPPVSRRGRNVMVRVRPGGGRCEQAVRREMRGEAADGYEGQRDEPDEPPVRHRPCDSRLVRVAAVLLDIDGVLQLSGAVIPRAPEAVERLRADGHRLRFVTNSTTRARAALAADLKRLGIELDAEEIETTSLAAARLLAGQRVFPLTMRAVHEDLARHVELVDADADVVLVGGADETDEPERAFAWSRLEAAFVELERGARLVCLHRNRWWQTASGPKLDSGALVAGLEYAVGVEAELVGKPSPAYFEAALSALGAAPEEAVMVGDDLEADVLAAMALGLEGVLVRTGKFREETLAAADPKPDAVLASVADLPPYLAARAESAA